MAESKGFEPSILFPVYSLSRGAPSTDSANSPKQALPLGKSNKSYHTEDALKKQVVFFNRAANCRLLFAGATHCVGGHKQRVRPSQRKQNPSQKARRIRRDVDDEREEKHRDRDENRPAKRHFVKRASLNDDAQDEQDQVDQKKRGGTHLQGTPLQLERHTSCEINCTNKSTRLLYTIFPFCAESWRFCLSDVALPCCHRCKNYDTMASLRTFVGG